VLFVSENWSNAHRENPYSLKAANSPGGASISGSAAGNVGVAEAWLFSPSMFSVESVNILVDGVHTGQITSVHN
jgi:hypothetical protein